MMNIYSGTVLESILYKKFLKFLRNYRRDWKKKITLIYTNKIRKFCLKENNLHENDPKVNEEKMDVLKDGWGKL